MEALCSQCICLSESLKLFTLTKYMARPQHFSCLFFPLLCSQFLALLDCITENVFEKKYN